MNRIDRVSAILIQLQSKRTVKAQEIADRFNISLRTVYRDVKALGEAGIPISGEAGIGYSIMEGYRLPPVMFTKEEAAAFLTAEKLVEKLTDASTKESYAAAMYKVKAVLRLAEKDYLEDIGARIAVIENQYVPKNTNGIPVQEVLKSLSDKRVLRIDYFAQHNQQQSSRDIEPVGIYYLGEYWYLIAYCRLRSDYRTFKFAHISNLQITDIYFTGQHPTLQTFLDKVSKEKEMYTVVILVDKHVIRYLGDQKFYHGFVSEKEAGDKVEMTFLTSQLQGFARWFLMFGDHADIVTPQYLKDMATNIFTAIKKRIQ